MNSRKVLIVTTGQPSTNPRMVKEYCSLKKAGFNVKVLYSFWASWAVDTDAALFRSESIDQKDFILVGGSPQYEKHKYFLSRLLHKAFRLLSYKFSLSFFDKWAVSRTAFWLQKAANNEKCDLYIAHNLGALPSVVKAAQKWNSMCAFDAEDYHRGEFKPPFPREYTVACKIEDRYMPRCNYVTAASPLIAERYRQNVNLKNVPLVINNVFALEHLQVFNDQINQSSELRLFWFSQTIGPERGLEKVINALNSLKEYKIQFTLLGKCSADYKSILSQFINGHLRLQFLEPVSPDEIFKIASNHHIGIASEEPICENRDICLTNKLFTYLLAGNCVLLSNTSAQKRLLQDYPGIGLIYNIHDPAHLAEQIRILYEDREILHNYRKAAWNLARTTLNWEKESTKLISLINEKLARA